jgi:hypothetical protein
MTTFFLLSFLGIVMPVILALNSGYETAGIKGALFALPVGLVIGFCNFYGLKTAGERCRRWIRCCREQRRSVRWPAFLMTLLLLWILFISGFLTTLISRAIIHLFGIKK